MDTPSAVRTPVPSPVARRWEAVVFLGFALWVGWFYLWTAAQPGRPWPIATREPSGYYGLETAGFREGHLYAKITPSPALLALKDPYDPVANAPYRVHDLTLFGGHYYLYFGVTPALILFWPVAALTGWYLSEPFAVALFCSGAIWVGMGLLLALRRRHFPGAPFLALVASWTCLALATPVLLLLESPQFYQVPISCAIFLQALMLAAIYRSLHSQGRAIVWLAVASLLFGLSIGARPNYLAGALVLLVPVAFLCRSAGWSPAEWRKGLLSRLLAAYGPTALCGIGLLAYNYARFGSVSEFGMHYQLGGERFTELKAVSLAYLVPHTAFYLFNAGLWQSYFPFFSSSSGQPYGLLRYVPWAWLALASFLPLRRGEPGEGTGRLAIVLALAGTSAANLALLACFFGTTSRYPGDYANAGLILAGVGALQLGQWAVQARLWRGVGTAACLAAAVSLSFSLCVYFGGFPRKDLFAGLARAANRPLYAWQKAHGNGFGGLRLEVSLPPGSRDTPEPLFETGRQADQRDFLQLDYVHGSVARLSFFHAGTGSFASGEFQVPSDRKLQIEARCGSLLPPFDHPAYVGWTRSEFERVSRDLRIRVNGREVLRAALDCYASSSANLSVGRLAWFTGGMDQSFDGSVAAEPSLVLEKPQPLAPRFTRPEPVEMTLLLPAAQRIGAEPLLVTGSGSQSDLLYCVYDGSNHIRFELDHFGSGGPKSDWIEYDPLQCHTVTVWMGSMAGSAGGGTGRTSSDRLVVLFDGAALIDGEQVFYPSTPETLRVGVNPYGSTTCGPEFTGTVVGIRPVGEGALPAVVRTGTYGAVEMDVSFPFSLSGTQEPLVVTGVTGAGDIVYVRYVDPEHVLFGFDHWGVGGFQGEPVEVDYSVPHRLSITLPSLYAPGDPAHRSRRLTVRLDGDLVLEAKSDCHPSEAYQIKIGKNPIGGSTCGPAFSGKILRVERFPAPNP